MASRTISPGKRNTIGRRRSRRNSSGYWMRRVWNTTRNTCCDELRLRPFRGRNTRNAITPFGLHAVTPSGSKCLRGDNATYAVTPWGSKCLRCDNALILLRPLRGRNTCDATTPFGLLHAVTPSGSKAPHLVRTPPRKIQARDDPGGVTACSSRHITCDNDPEGVAAVVPR